MHTEHSAGILMSPDREIEGQSLLAKFEKRLAAGSSCVLKDAERDAKIYTRLMGVGGRPPAPLRTVAAEFSLSAERVRQVCERIGDRVVPTFVGSPDHDEIQLLLRQALTAVLDCCPGTVKEVSVQVARLPPVELHGSSVQLLRPGADARSLIFLAQLLALPCPVRLERWGEVEAIVPADMPSCFNLLLPHARKIGSASGAVNLRLLADSFWERKRIHLRVTDIERIIESFAVRVGDSQANPHGPHDQWFMFPDVVNKPVIRAEERIATLGWCSLSNLCAFAEIDQSKGSGNGRPQPVDGATLKPNTFSRSKYLTVIPPDVMAHVLTLHGLLVDGDRVSQGDCEIQRKLPETQEKMVRIFWDIEKKGPVLQKTFLSECGSQGINLLTAKAYLYRSGLFYCMDGICTLTP